MLTLSTLRVASYRGSWEMLQKLQTSHDKRKVCVLYIVYAYTVSSGWPDCVSVYEEAGWFKYDTRESTNQKQDDCRVGGVCTGP